MNLSACRQDRRGIIHPNRFIWGAAIGVFAVLLLGALILWAAWDTRQALAC